MTCELVCTGWYSSKEARTYQTYGDDVIRGPEFREIWNFSIAEFINPKEIFITDSASPLKPNLEGLNGRSQAIELLMNPGHAQNSPNHYCGAMSAITLGLEYALHSGVDYFLYIEQDALIFGKDFLNILESKLRRNDLILGEAKNGGEIEHSIFAVNRRFIRKFLARLHEIPFADKQLSPELKFMIAGSKYPTIYLFPLLYFSSWDRSEIQRRVFSRLLRRVLTATANYSYLPFGYGRQRPINFDDRLFYFQQGTQIEIQKYTSKTGLVLK